jgi:hypothetical protein
MAMHFPVFLGVDSLCLFGGQCVDILWTLPADFVGICGRVVDICVHLYTPVAGGILDNELVIRAPIQVFKKNPASS